MGVLYVHVYKSLNILTEVVGLLDLRQQSLGPGSGDVIFTPAP